MDNPIALAALSLSVITTLYTIFLISPKDSKRKQEVRQEEFDTRVKTLEISDAVREQELSQLVATVDKLANLVYDWIKMTTGMNGNGNRNGGNGGRSKR